MPDRKKALIAGATESLAEIFCAIFLLWTTGMIAVSRRKPDVDGRTSTSRSICLTERRFEALKRPRGVTHVFFSAYIERPTWAEMVAPNQTMLVNLMDAMKRRHLISPTTI